LTRLSKIYEMFEDTRRRKSKDREKRILITPFVSSNSSYNDQQKKNEKDKQ